MVLGSAMLEVVIGLAFVYLLFSLICSAVNEWISGILKLRANTLREGIGTLLEDPNFENLAKQFYAHPLMQGLTRKGKENRPSYISPEVFVNTLLDIVSPKDADVKPPVEVYRNVLDQISELSKTNSAFGRTLLSLVSAAGITPTRLEEAAKSLQSLGQTRDELRAFIEQAETEIDQIQTAGDVVDKLRAVEDSIRETELEVMASVEAARENIKQYFDDSMDRVSGWYKRRAQVAIVIIATVVTVVMNVDSIDIANSVATNPTLRESIVASAEGYLQQPDISSSDDALATFEEIQEKVDTLGIPIGWQEMPNGAGAWVYKVIGLLITIAAVSQGAPFWFDLLNKLVNIRMAGKKPEEASGTAPPQVVVVNSGGPSQPGVAGVL